MKDLLLPALALWSATYLLAPAGSSRLTGPQEPGPLPEATAGEQEEQEPALGELTPEALAPLFASAGIGLDLEHRLVTIPVNVAVRDELLEYLLVASWGAVHESLFVTEVDPELLNVGLLSLGLEQGSNAVWFPRDPPPTEEQLRAGESAYEISLPEGDRLYLYVAWQDGDERYFFRIEDVLRNLDRRASMQRHGWVYLGSRMILHGSRQEERFAAGVDGNLINISFFSSGNTIVTAAMDECVKQTVWLPNPWILPRRDAKVSLVLSRTRLQAMPESVASSLPDLAEQSFMDEDWRR